MIGRKSDQGFVLVDALAAAAVLAFAGTTVLLIASAAISRAEEDLDRSLALLTIEGFAAELRLATPESMSVAFPFQQGHLRYELSSEPTVGSGRRHVVSVYRSSRPDQPLLAVDVPVANQAPPSRGGA